MVKVPDAATIATVQYLETVLNRKVGGSTGTNVYGALQILSRFSSAERPVTIMSMICDPGERYLDTYFNPAWVAERGFEVKPFTDQLDCFFETGRFSPNFFQPGNCHPAL
jgi:cysteine synthase A